MLLLNYTEWLAKINEGSRGLERSIRARVSMFKPAIQAGEHPELKAPVDYKGTNDARRDLHAAAQRAQMLNRQYGGKVPVYHSIIPSRKTRGLDATLRFLHSKNGTQEQSVSVKKGIWDAGMVLVGTAKLLYYWETDIHTKGIPGNPGMKIPLDAHRPKDFRPYDEALIRLSDVQWHEMYVDFDNEQIVQAGGGYDGIKALADQYGLKLKHTAMAHESSPLSKRYEFQVTIDHLSEPNKNLRDDLLAAAEKVRTDPHKFDPKVVEFAIEVHKIVEKLDPLHQSFIKFPEKRSKLMQQTFDQLKSLHDKFKMVAGNDFNDDKSAGY